MRTNFQDMYSKYGEAEMFDKGKDKHSYPRIFLKYMKLKEKQFIIHFKAVSNNTYSISFILLTYYVSRVMEAFSMLH